MRHKLLVTATLATPLLLVGCMRPMASTAVQSDIASVSVRFIMPPASQGGELIRIVADVVQEPQDETRADLSATDGHGAHDGHPPLVSRHPRDQVLPVIDGLRQYRELRATSDEVRAHGQDAPPTYSLVARVS